MTEDEAFDELEKRLKQQAQAKEADNLTRAHTAAAEFISTQTADLLAITTLRKAFEYGYRTGFRDASKEKK
jgi:phage regulator Rha-like protein